METKSNIFLLTVIFSIDIFSNEKRAPASKKPCSNEHGSENLLSQFSIERKKAFSLRRKPIYRAIGLFLYGYNLLLVVRTAVLAYSVRHHQCTALAALNQSRSTHLPVCSSLISSTFRRFVLGTNRHRFTPPYTR